jgi:hypothetical protein
MPDSSTALSAMLFVVPGVVRGTPHWNRAHVMPGHDDVGLA